ncbi:MAG: peptidase S16 [Alphaproteobacteria bacterium]|nr:peptidase S16 [Alphaproteobacteria bacterium]
MRESPLFPHFEDLPEILPIFPLTGVLLLPGGALPLNIFEPRYLAMVDEAMKTNRLIGMVQPRHEENADDPFAKNLFNIGCAGRVTGFEETEDGRYQITLTGVCRYKITEEQDMLNGFRRVTPDWSDFREDMKAEGPCLDIERSRMTGLLKRYFEANGLTCDWEAVEVTPDERLITCLAMVCPLEPKEKQALLEAENCRIRAEMFLNLLEMAVRESESGCGSGCTH